jgi:hypothetical protein
MAATADAVNAIKYCCSGSELLGGSLLDVGGDVCTGVEEGASEGDGVGD